MRSILFVLFFLICAHAQSNIYKITRKKDSTQTTTLKIESHKSNYKPIHSQKILRSLPYYVAEGSSGTSHIIYTEEITDTLSEQDIAFFQNSKKSNSFRYLNTTSTEVRTLVDQGPTQNRINLTILGDGYTLSEKEKFFSDAERITKSLFSDETFTSYLPLFKVHAVFVASKISGIGDGEPINTAFGLYRTPKGSKRSIFPSNERALEAALRLAPKTDYPIVIANDDYYGGLGGRYAISTRSERSGMIVLRHELGHNFGDIGEEYDGGSVYSGANSSASASASKWQHWKTDNNVYTAKLLSSDYIWQNLSNKPYSIRFNTQPNETMGIELSTVGWSSPSDVYVYLNGQKLELPGDFHNDRNFYILDNVNVRAGQNTLDVKENKSDNDNVLATASIYSYPQNYNFTPDTTASFATYDSSGRKSYRPTHNSCLMRNMMLKHFCSVDQENMWLKFLNRISLIDNLAVEADFIEVQTPELNFLKIFWFDENNKEITFLRNNKKVYKKAIPQYKALKVVVEFSTPEVKNYTSDFRVEKIIRL
ncbi:MAG: M64 family metallopeptidase [Pseudobdellovibrio sp.]